MELKKYAKKTLLIILIISVSFSIGAYSGVTFYKNIIKGKAVGSWVKGAESLKNGQKDLALSYFTQAVALKDDEPMFFCSVAEVYELERNTVMAIAFYKMALDLYEKEKKGPAERIKRKIERLEQYLKETVNKENGGKERGTN